MLVTLDQIHKAKANLAGVTHKTPLLFQKELSEMCENDIYLKLENLQLTGSFKVRGAFNKVSSLTQKEKENGVVAFSAGNHGAGTAYAAQVLGIPSTIVMPNTPNPEKKESIISFGSKVVLGGETSVEMFEKALDIQNTKRMTMIHPFNDPYIISGQGSVGIEILEDLPEVDVVICAVSGGGLISGVATAIKETRPRTKVIGVNTEGAQAMYQSIRNGEITEVEEVNTIADGLMAKKPGDLTFSHTEKYVDDLILVSEENIRKTVALLAKTTKTIVEPSGAAAIASLLAGNIKYKKKKVAVIVSGGNVENKLFTELIQTYSSTGGEK